MEVNSDPVLHPDSVDFPVKSKLIPEMFNILGLHIPQVQPGNNIQSKVMHRELLKGILFNWWNSFLTWLSLARMSLSTREPPKTETGLRKTLKE